jgi:hypothetical protein
MAIHFHYVFMLLCGKVDEVEFSGCSAKPFSIEPYSIKNSFYFACSTIF